MVSGAPPAPRSAEEKRRLLAELLERRARPAGTHPLSFAQQRLWFIEQLEPGGAAYNVPGVLRLSGPLDVPALERSLSEIVRRHEALRTTFRAGENGRPEQVVGAPWAVRLPIVDLRGLCGPERGHEIARRAREEAARPFDLAAGPLLRGTLLRTADHEVVALFTLHHIVSDEWSVGVLMRELGALYRAFSRGEASPLAPLERQYADYAAWQRGWLRGEVLERQLAFWRERLAGAPPLLALPADRPRPAAADGRGAVRTFTLPRETARAVRALARREGATLFMTLLAAFQALLARWSGQDDVCVGTPVANRTRLETEGLIGFFVNTLVVRTGLSGDPTVAELLARVREAMLGAQTHQDLPFDRLVDELKVERSLGHAPLFQSVFVLETPREPVDLGGVRLEMLEGAGGRAKFDLVLRMAERGEELTGSATYRTDLWDGETIDRLLGHFARLVEAFATGPERRLSELEMLDDSERHLVLEAWNAPPAPLTPIAPCLRLNKPACLLCPRGPAAGARLVHDLVALQALRTPDAPAVIFGGETLTYAELEARANRVARHLRRKGAGPDALVAVFAERSAELVVGILGTLKAGAAYVPLDPAYPAERLRYMLDDSGARILLTQSALEDRIPETSAGVVRIDADWPAIAAESAEPFESGVDADNLAYVIYTSGSTGKPKGAAIPHRSLSGYLDWFCATVLREGDFAQPLLSRISFDASMRQVFPPLLRGAAVWVLPEETISNPAALLDEIAPKESVAFGCVPSLWGAMLDEINASGRVPSNIHRLLLGGEALSPEMVERTRSILPNVEIWNHYGPTEATVNTTAARVETGRGITLGRAVAGKRVYVLDAHLHPSPVGVAGELFVGGRGLGRGYLGRPAMTAERFIPDPFAAEPGGRMYRSGDRVRWLAAGELEYQGRIDEQVKIRGFRIEPGEIEAVLADHPMVREAVAVVREDAPGDPRLVAYVVGEDGAAPSAADLRAWARERLPEYMVPAAFVALDAMPLSPNGKVERRALPAPDGGDAAAEYVAPRTETERALAAIWAEVLRVDQVGVHDDFFDLGGHSLLATRLVSRVREALKVDLPLRTLFEAPTVAELAAQVAPALAADDGPAVPPLAPAPRDRPLPLSFAQQRLWFIDQLEPGSAAYNVPMALRLRGALDAGALARSLAEVVRRHEVLRTTFATVDGEAVQVIGPPSPVALPAVDLRALPAGVREAEARRLAAAESARPFDLSTGPMLRAALLRLADDDAVLLFTLHHIASDGWSEGVLVREVSALYGAFSRGLPSPLAELPVQYADFAVWQRRWLEGEALERQAAYWRERLAGAPPLLELPTDRPRGAVAGARAGIVPFAVDTETTGALRALARAEGATLYMTLLAAFQLLLSRWSGQGDVSVGSPVANRTRLETEALIGFFVNTLVMRADVGAAASFRDLLRQAREASLGAQAHQDLPFERLVEELAPERSLGHTPLFQAMIVLQNAERAPLELGGITMEPLDGVAVPAKFDLLLVLEEEGDGVAGGLRYRADLYDDATVQRLLTHFAALLKAVAAAPALPLADVSLLSADERRVVVEDWNDTAVEYPRHAGIPALFAAQADATPDAVAVVFGDDSLTYRELDARADRLAAHLARHGVGAETRVGICLERSLELVVSILAILKAGGAYVPLDPGYPAERLAFMLADSGVAVLLTQASLRAALPEGAGMRVVCVDALADDADGAASDISMPAAGPRSLAYVMYTSGSTGTPKGVGIEHRSIVRLVRGANYAELGADEVFLQAAPVSFDAATLELWGPLLNGGRVVLMPGATPSLQELGDAIRRHGVTTLWLTAGLFQVMVEERLDDLGGLRQLLSGGDVLPAPQVAAVRRRFPHLRLINGYGPTENTTFTCCFTVPHGWSGGSIPIGAPISNTRVYVLDAALRPVPAGVPGELYAGGHGVARGYVGRPAATAERFLPDPFGAEPGARMYRTGDRVRWRADGTVEYLGRLDEQVKVRGFRIELGEVEAVLRRHPSVADCVVVAREDAPGEKRLVAYVVADGTAPPADALRAWVRERLPEYMVPAACVAMDALPLSPNGKVDRKALPAPQWAAAEAHVAPRTETERALAALWAEVLRMDTVGVHDGFFEMGGHSLLATRLVSRVREALHVDLPLRALFEAPTIAELAGEVEALRASVDGPAAPPLVPVPRGRPLPLSFAQQRLWFIDQLEPGSPAYNVPVALRLRGTLDAGALVLALTEVVRRHEVLRTTFATVDGEAVQVIGDPSPVLLPVLDLAHLPADAREAEARRLAAEEAARPFDLATGPMLRAALLRLAHDDAVLLFTLHHIASDGWSEGVLVREVSALYAAFARGEASPLAELPVQYADYAVWQRRWLEGDVLERQADYWRARLAGAPPLLELPTDRPRGAEAGARGGTIPISLDGETAAALRELSRREGATLYMTLLAAFQLLLSRWSGQDDVSVGSPVANRTRLETEGMIGFFVNTLVLRGDLSGDPTVGELLARTREGVIGAQAHQDLPFERLVEALEVERSLGHAPLFQVLFSLDVRAPGEVAPTLAGMELEVLEARNHTVKFDLVLHLTEDGDAVRGSLAYRADLFEHETAARMAEQLRVLLAAMAADPHRRVSALPLLTAAEHARVVEEWNATARPVDPRPVHALFAEHAALAPHAPAVSDGAVTLGYGELEARANRLARLLASRGVGPESRVGVCMERSAELVVAVLAVLKAGGAYVALDPAYPRDRLAYMVADADVRLLLTQDRIAHRLSDCGADVFRVDADWTRVEGESAEPLAVEVAPEGLAYVIYTSGSTGRPKGVHVEHRALASLAAWHRRAFAVAPEDRATLLAGVGFDASVWEVWPYLTAGASLRVVDDESRGDPARLRRWLAEHGTTVSFLPTPLAEAVLALPWPETGSLRVLLTGGDRLHAPPPEGLPFTLVNNYGPTEAAVVATSGAVAPGGDAVPAIGAPVDNARAYVLDRHLRPVPRGAAGELFVGGAGVARGYGGRPALTAAQFRPDPWSAVPGARMYRTGDRVRWTAEGTLEFLGRLDVQVKVRGFRIEPGEIEAELLQDDEVAGAVVVLRGDTAGERRLVAYVVGRDGVAPAASALRARLAERLPDYMVPQAFVALDAIPLTPNGKPDRRALPAPDADHPDDAFRAPETATEEILAAIWCEVLGVERVGAGDDFFARGGHSLLATRLASRVRDTFRVELPLRAVFEAPTLQALAGRVDALLRSGEAPRPPIGRAPRGGELPLSFAQQRMWFLDQIHPGSPAYNIPTAVRLRGALDVAALRKSLAEVVRRHEALRTTFAGGDDGRAVQVVAEAGITGLPEIDLSALPDAIREREAAKLARGEALRPFDLSRGPLLRSALLRRSGDELTLLVTLHHIVGDGWSVDVLVREVGAIYDAFARGEAHPLAELPLQYADYAVWQREWLRGEVLERELGYWRERLAGAPPLLALPTDRPRPPVAAGREGRLAFALPDETARALRALARREGTTLFMTLLAAFQALLARWTGQADVSVGSPVANRTRLETEGLIGFFANTLVLRADLSGDPTVGELLERVRDAVLGAQTHQDLPFERLVDELKVERSLGHAPLVQAVFSMQERRGDDAAPRLGGVEIAPEAPAEPNGAAKFDLILRVAERDGDRLTGSLSYRADLFDAATAERLAGHFARLAEAFAAGPERRLSQLEMLDAAERAQVIDQWNALPAPRETRPVHEQIAARAAQTPDAPAVVFGAETLTYAELEARANRVARHLRRKGAGPDALVAVFAERSAELVVAILGTLKAGAAYVPLDPGYPAERLRYMLDDSGAGILLTQSALAARLPDTSAEVVRIDADWPAIAAESAEPVDSGVHPDNLAYVIYTSGSTGRPKGAAIPHRSLSGYLDWFCATVLREGDFAQPLLSRISFDASMRQLFPPLLRGAPVWVLPDETIASPTALLDEIAPKESVAFGCVPSLWGAMLDEIASSGRVPANIHRLLLGGEALSPEMVERTRALLPDVEIWNHYGPTEATVNTTAVRVEAGRGITLGRAVAGKRVYVLDAHLRPAPLAVAGELYVGGAGLGRGYLGRPAMTAERFVPDPFAAGPGGRMYCSGDRVRWLAAGELEYLGRTDEQVKVRGFRIELGEIEAVLADHPAVREAVAVVREDVPGERRLVAYVVADESGAAPASADLRAWAKERLPEYMVPAAYVALGAMPLSPNGKVERRALPAPEWTGDDADHVAPRTGLEATLAAIWSEVLRVERVGVHDDFFALGGDSILSIQVVARARKAGLLLTPRHVFECPTVAEQAVVCAEAEDAALEEAGVHAPADDAAEPEDFALAGIDADMLAFLEDRLSEEDEGDGFD